MDEHLADSIDEELELKVRIGEASRARITEVEIALLKDHIRQRSTQFKRYERTYNSFGQGYYDHDLPLAVFTESSAKFPNDDEGQIREARKLNRYVVDAVKAAISSKRE